MSSQWLILMISISFLQLAIGNVINGSLVANALEDNIKQTRDLTSDVAIERDGFDTSYYYRLKNRESGMELALDVKNDGKLYELNMKPISRNTGQFWQFVHLGENIYKLQTRFLGNKYSLDINPNSKDKNIPHMAKTALVTGQRWWISRLTDSTYTLSNEYNGVSWAMDISSSKNLETVSDSTYYTSHQSETSDWLNNETTTMNISTTISSTTFSTTSSSDITTTALPKSLSGGAIAGIVIGAIVGVILIVLIAYIIYKYRKSCADKLQKRSKHSNNSSVRYKPENSRADVNSAPPDEYLTVDTLPPPPRKNQQFTDISTRQIGR
ncbi:unnamed protein product [Adineta steineri]|uniref:Uncharacterized protein n=1 Tax=Adineta steineri TaxID=433720 RepID=A0A818X9K6_9BILA|nr:unnamed protein product [Adineta steineri]